MQGDLIHKGARELGAQGDLINKQHEQIDSQNLKISNQEKQLKEQSIKIEQILPSEKLFCGVPYNKLFIVGAVASGLVVFLKK